MRIDDPHISVKVKDIQASDETIKMLILDPMDQIDWLIEQKKILEDILTKEDLIDEPIFQLKLASLEKTIEKAQASINEMVELCIQFAKNTDN